MLPPVRAALNSNTDHSGLAPQTTSRARIDIAQAIALPDDDGAMPLSGRSLDLVSLSGQLKLAQGSSIFAETIGRLLKMPRQENEPLADYAARLTEAVQALKPAERAALERMLNQLVKGISVRLLTEILKDPAGPTAARIALHMETASSSERDLVAKAVISSYRQNASSDLQPGQTGARPAQPVAARQAAASAGAPNTLTIAQQGSAPGAAGVTQPPAQQTVDASNPLAAAVQAEDAGQAGKEPQAQRLSTGVSAAQPQAFVQSPASSALTRTAIAAQPQPADGTPAPAGDGDGAGTLAVVEQKTKAVVVEGRIAQSAEATRAQAFTAKVAARPAEQAVAAGMPGKSGQTAEVDAGDDEKRPARLSRETLKQELMLAARQSMTTRAEKPISDLFGWLAGLFTEPEAPQQAHTAARPAAQAGLPPGEGAEQALVAQDGEKAEGGMPGATASPADKTSAKAEPNPAATRPQAAPAGQVAAETVEQQITAGMAAAVVATVREGIPHPYISYPPAEDEPERQERKARAIAEIGDEEEGGRAQDHGYHGEEQPDDEADGEALQDDAQADDLVLADNDEGRPNDLYWRMAGWR